MNAGQFWGKVAKGEGCWLWLCDTDRKGYGRFQVRGHGNRKTLKAHRVAWELTYGPIPDGLCVCHRCDTPACVRPEHLWLGTAAENNRDRKAKGRNANTHGENHPRAKLTWEIVNQIRSEYTGGPGEIQLLARRFGVRASSIRFIVRNEQWVVST